MTVRFYSSIAQQTTLTGTYSPSATVIAVAGTTGFPSTTPYTLSLDYGAPNEELVEVTGVAGLSLTVTRAIDGTSATTHNAGAVVRHVSSARDFADSRAHENASTAVHGLTGAVVGTTDTQTLSNKTLTAPVITGAVTLASPTITGTVAGGATYTGITMTNNPVVTGNMDVNGTAAGTAQLDVMAASGQTASIQRWLSSGGTTLASVNNAGRIIANIGVDATASVASAAALTATAAASQTANIFTVRNSTPTDLVQVASDGRLNALNGVTLVGDPSPGTGGVVMKAGPSATRVAEFQNAAGSPQVTIDNVGLLTANNLTLLGEGAWTVFTPLWTSTGTAPAIGNGSLTGGYRQHGRTITVRWFWQAGSTTTFGTGTWFLSFPSGKPHANVGGNQVGVGAAFGSRSTFRNGTAQADPSDLTRIRISDAAVGTLWGATVPATWASGDYINVTMTYETDNSI